MKLKVAKLHSTYIHGMLITKFTGYEKARNYRNYRNNIYTKNTHIHYLNCSNNGDQNVSISQTILID